MSFLKDQNCKNCFTREKAGKTGEVWILKVESTFEVTHIRIEAVWEYFVNCEVLLHWKVVT